MPFFLFLCKEIYIMKIIKILLAIFLIVSITACTPSPSPSESLSELSSEFISEENAENISEIFSEVFSVPPTSIQEIITKKENKTEIKENVIEKSTEKNTQAIINNTTINPTPVKPETSTNSVTTTEVTTSTTVSTTGYPKTYSDGTCNITIYKEWYKNAWCYAAHLKFTDYSRFGTACGNGYYGGYETTSHAANRLGAILAVNGCYSAPNLNYIVVRKGYIHNGSSRGCWVPAIYSSYTGKLLNSWETGGVKGVAGRQVSSLVSEGTLTDTFNFGPPFLSNGYIQSYGSDRAQRTFIGTNGSPGDIWLVVSDGRYNDGVSAGLSGYECASYLLSKGCTFGVPLDGGGSSTMVFQGKVLNAVTNERAVVDFVYFK